MTTLARVDDPVRYARYATLATHVIAQHGGRFLVRGEPQAVLEGTLEPNRAVIVWFESAEAARACYGSAAYRAAREERLGAARFEMVMVEAPEGFRP